MRTSSKAFSLLEVVIALAMLALIALPAIGLATMLASRNQEILTTGDASELKRRIDAAIRAYTDDENDGIFDWGLSATQDLVTFYGSSDLRYIEIDGSVTEGENDQFYEVNLRQPVGYDFVDTDPYRIVVYEVLWTPPGAREQSQLFFTSVFRK